MQSINGQRLQDTHLQLASLRLKGMADGQLHIHVTRHCLPPPTSTKRGRNTTTRGTGCQYSVLAKESLDKTTWILKHRIDKRFSTHNHELSQHPSAHPVEPLRIESRLQSSSIPKINTRREPSQFEVVQRALSTCSKCHRAGHIMTSRKCPLRYSELQPQPPSAPSAPPVPSVPAVPAVPSASPVPSVPAVPQSRQIPQLR